MTHPLASPARSVLAAALALAALAACGGGGASTAPDPGDTLFAGGLGHYDAATAAQSAARTARTAGDLATESRKLAQAVSEYGLARDAFTALRNDPSLCPAVSVRCDNAAYLAGRCSYEIGTIQNDAASFQDAVVRLDTMLADFPASNFAASASYFDGRARFQLTSGGFPLASFADAEVLFERSLALAPAGTWADNALYYDGRCEFELGVKLVVPLSPAPGTPAYAEARSWFDQAAAALRSLPTRFPTSSYRDDAAYYLGRSLFERPFDAADTASVTERTGNLGGAIGALGAVLGDAASILHPGAFYWRGRAEYARSTYPGFETDLAAALADFAAVPSTSVYHDNALGYVVRTEVRQESCVAACTDYTTLKALYPTSAATSSAGSYLATAPAGTSGVPCSCGFPVP